MKKIFILTGETSGDKLAASVITKLKEKNSNINYLSVGGSYLNSIGIKSIFDLKEITYLGFTIVLLNIFKIKKKIDITVSEIIKLAVTQNNLFKNNISFSKPIIIFIGGGSKLLSKNFNFDLIPLTIKFTI